MQPSLLRHLLLPGNNRFFHTCLLEFFASCLSLCHSLVWDIFFLLFSMPLPPRSSVSSQVALTIAPGCSHDALLFSLHRVASVNFSVPLVRGYAPRGAVWETELNLLFPFLSSALPAAAVDLQTLCCLPSQARSLPWQSLQPGGVKVGH